jgi:hypothetical protein
MSASGAVLLAAVIVGGASGVLPASVLLLVAVSVLRVPSVYEEREERKRGAHARVGGGALGRRRCVSAGETRRGSAGAAVGCAPGAYGMRIRGRGRGRRNH